MDDVLVMLSELVTNALRYGEGDVEVRLQHAPGVLDQATATNAAVAEHGALLGLDDFVIGLLGRLDLHSGVLHLVTPATSPLTWPAAGTSRR